MQAVKLKGLHSVRGWSHYFVIISRVVTSTAEDRVDSVILGIDIRLDTENEVNDDDNDDDDDENDNDVEDVDDDDDDDEDDEEKDAGSVNSMNTAMVGLVLPITSSMSVCITGRFVINTTRACLRNDLVSDTL